MTKSATLTAALEDYLEAILNLSRHGNAARSRDIAEALGVHKSTVTAALKSLGHQHLINYAPYEAVTLTQEGERLAEDVADRHRTLKDFFIEVLNVDPETAETAACGMEHALPREIVDKLTSFADSVRDCPLVMGAEADGAGGKKKCEFSVCGEAPARNDTAGGDLAVADTVKDSGQSGGKEGKKKMILTKGASGVKSQSLAEAPVRDSYRVDRVSGPEQRRLCEMGLVEGAEISVVNRSRPGTMVLKVGGCRLALARNMARYVWVR